jgi:outer membrane protein OmpA-like peptidoglycan-associated protein
MNAFGMRRFRSCQIFLSILFCAGPAFGAVEQKPAALDLKYSSLPIAGQVLDLKFSVEDLGGGAGQLKGKDEGTAGAGSALKGDVVDLKAASADLKAAGAEIKESATEIKISLQGEILFDFDKSNLRPAAESTLAQVAKMIGSYPRAQVLIEGYTDSKGSNSYNAKLSDRRAVSVKTWFAKHGVAANSMQTHGWGAAKPVAPNTHLDGSDDPDGRQKNRRVEITIKK